MKKIEKIELLFQALLFDRRLCYTASEIELVKTLTTSEPKIIKYRNENNQKKLLEELSKLAPSINDFFDNVYINTIDAKQKLNRHRLISCIMCVLLKSKIAEAIMMIERIKTLIQ